MKNNLQVIWNKVASWAKTHKLLATICGAFIVIVLVLVFRSDNTQTELVSVKRGSVAEKVSVTGQVASAEEVSLAFEKSGRVTRLAHDVGSRVEPGEVIVSLDASDLGAQLAQYQASVAAAQAKLEELQRGSRPEEIQIKETALAQANQNLASTYSGIAAALESDFSYADDSVRRQTDAFFNDDESLHPRLSFSTYDNQAQIDAENGRYAVRLELDAFQDELTHLNAKTPSQADWDAELVLAKKHLDAIRSFLTKVSEALVQQSGLSASTVTTYQTSLNTARTQIAAALKDVSAQMQDIATGKLAVSKAADDLALTKAGSSAETIKAQQAVVAQAQANVLQIQAQLGKMYLRSPIRGVVTKADVKVGEIVAPNTTLVSIISDSKFQVEARIPEVDVGKVAVGNPVDMTLDAFPGDVFKGKVFYIDPAETVVQGVVNYKIKISFDESDTKIKSGLTANIEIRTKEKNDVLYLPQFAILQTDAGTFVKVPDGDAEKEIPITIGIRDQNGNVEILSGVSEGDKVLNIGLK